MSNVKQHKVVFRKGFECESGVLGTDRCEVAVGIEEFETVSTNEHPGYSIALGRASIAVARGDGSFAITPGHMGSAEATGEDSVAIGWWKVKAGERGMIIVLYHDAEYRIRAKIGYVGENGIKPNTYYSLDDENEARRMQFVERGELD